MLSVNLLSGMRDLVFMGLLLCVTSLPARGANTSVTMSHKLSAGSPSNLRPASNEIISASVLLCDTAACFLQVNLLEQMCGFPK